MSLDIIKDIDDKFLKMHTSSPSFAQSWELASLSDGWFKIGNKWQPEKYLRGNNVPIMQKYANFESQMWKLIKIERIDKIPEPLAIMSTSQLDQIYDGRGSGARNDIAIYRPRNTAGYYSLGDVGVRKNGVTYSWYKIWRWITSLNMPSLRTPKNAFLYKELIPGALAKPVRYDKIWQNRGTGVKHDVTLWRPIPSPGYTCIGDVAVRSYS